ncbi:MULTISPECIES: hypothetical protein [Prochlorococcus]|uniref:hypothetical protein n=1 Tax=Prochlorococcus TaxID=1218 RepID=UPI000533B4F9|nr:MULTISPECIES: hypothetical protein [Prochlorococcus]KGG13612.1 hypothetical protein EV05_0269 [Prochlorococcus sp. MIT 0601]
MSNIGEEGKGNLFNKNFEKNNLEKSLLQLTEEDKILCIHCKRTKNNGLRCLGICVADNEY